MISIRFCSAVICFLLLVSCKKEQSGIGPALAEQVTIYRDTWGIPHVQGETDAATVFGLLYAQCEDNFTAVEYNLVKAMGRLAEWDGKNESLIRDLRIRLHMDLEEARVLYQTAPEWIQTLCMAASEGVNWYLETHPELHPRLISHFEPWMWVFHFEGSITKNIDNNFQGPYRNTIENFYLKSESSQKNTFHKEEGESNSFAIGNSLSASGNPMLYINPHTSLHFRTEAHMISNEGLNAYGAITWGQFFIYQGFNDQNGWAHTTSYADNIDQFVLKTVTYNNRDAYLFNGDTIPVNKKKIDLFLKSGKEQNPVSFQGIRTALGPVTHKLEDGSLVVTKLHWSPLKTLEQSLRLMKTNNLGEFEEVMQAQADASNNTMYSGKDGHIAYFHGNFMPRRPENKPYDQPYAVEDSTQIWQGVHPLSEMITVKDPENGWIISCNSTPFKSAGAFSPKPENYPRYMARDPENLRVRLAEQLFSKSTSLDLNALIDLAYYPEFPAHSMVRASLLEAYSNEKEDFDELEEPMALLEAWNGKADQESVAYNLTTLYLFEGLKNELYPIKGPGDIIPYVHFLTDSLSDAKELTHFKHTIDSLENNWERWKVTYGEAVRYQRNADGLSEEFSDSLPSLPTARGSGIWGDLSPFEAFDFEPNSSWYGLYGNSFVAAVEFGKTIKAKALMAGGQSANPDSPHFDDQARMYTQGAFREVWFYREEFMNNLESQYHPGEEISNQPNIK